ncbi:MAG: isoaspartyl peptidase/L-asparaginase, partial [Actinomycetota bacterium]|nr:isoaspartyl peptidase/L-asparaginase [Actinomycetota bacterium]
EHGRRRGGEAGAHGPLGTVGAAVRDADGHLAAATSTGGVAGGAPGRVGDSAIPGAGTFADDRSCAVSATGRGEAILEAVLAHAVSARIVRGEVGVQRAVEEALADVRGHAGLIVVDREGRTGAAAHPGVFLRARAGPEGPVGTALAADGRLTWR